MRAFVTGGSGFLGQRLIETLVARRAFVRALARSPKSEAVVKAAGAEPSPGDLHDPQALADGMEGVDCVIHAAGHLVPWDSYRNFYRTNVTGTKTVLAAAKKARVRQFVAIGAAAVIMGRPRPILGADETYPMQRPGFGPYIATKTLAEIAVRRANSKKMSTCVVRPPVIWGPRSHMLPSIAETIERGRFVWVGGGRVPISTCHVDNVSHAAALAAERGGGGAAYFVTDGQDSEFRSFFSRQLEAIGVKVPERSIPFRAAWYAALASEIAWRTLPLSGAPPISRETLRLIGKPFTVTIDKARYELGYEPAISVEQGLAAMGA